MKYLHESDVDTGTHADLAAVRTNIENTEGITDYCDIVQSPVRYNEVAIPIISTAIENNLTTSEQNALVDTESYKQARNSQLPEFEEWQIIIANFLSEWDEADFDYPQDPYSRPSYVAGWDDTPEKTYRLWKIFKYNNDPFERGTANASYADAAAFVLDNIEDTANNQILFRYDSIKPHHLIFWTNDFDYPGNPYHINTNENLAMPLIKRAIMGAGVSMIMMFDDGNNTRAHYRWGIYSGLGRIIHGTRNQMPKMLRDAMITGLERCYEEYLINNHYGLQSTLDQEQRMGVLLWALSVDPSLRQYAMKQFQEKSIYNFRYGKYDDHSLDHDGGIDLGYQGRSDRRAMWSKVIAEYEGYGEYVQHFDYWYNKWMKFRRYQLMPEPNEGGHEDFHGTTGLNIGTADTHALEQGGDRVKDHAFAYWYPTNGAWQVFKYGGRRSMDTVATMRAELPGKIESVGKSLFNRNYNEPGLSQPWRFASTYNHTEINYKYTAPDEYATLSPLKNNLSVNNVEDSDSDQIKNMYEGSKEFLTKCGDAVFAKFNAGQSDEYGFQIWNGDLGFRGSVNNAGSRMTGINGGWGSIWTKQTGLVGNSVTRDPQTPDGHEDTVDSINSAVSYYTGCIGGWGINHIAGRLTGTNNVFSTGMRPRKYDTIDYKFNGNTVTDSTKEIFDNSNSIEVIATCSLKSRHNYKRLSGDIDIENKYNGDTTGFTVEKTITAQSNARSTNSITELWEYIPINLLSRRQDEQYRGSIAYKTTGGYQSFNDNTTVNNVTGIRVKRYGVNRYYIPDSTVHPNGWTVKNYGDWRDDVQFDREGKILGVDLHGNNGTAKDFPATTKVKYKFQLTDG